jgi:protein-export membrane protein SecD
MSSHFRWLVFIVVLTVASLWVVLPNTPKPEFLLRGQDLEKYDECLEQEADLIRAAGDDVAAAAEVDLDCEHYEGSFEFTQGLDLVGGLRVLLQVELSKDEYADEDLAKAAQNIERRVSSLGLVEARVQVQTGTDIDRILVEIPGVTNRQQALATIQQTALLEFVDFTGLGAEARNYEGRCILTDQQLEIREQRASFAAEANAPEATPEATPEVVSADGGCDSIPIENWISRSSNVPFETVMTGSALKAAVAVRSQQDFTWMIQFDLNTDDEGGANFGPFTGSHIGEPLAIVLDGKLLSAPVIQSELPDGGVITGQFTEEEAKTLALQLRSGALPIPLRIESDEHVGATLGQESVEKSIRAGVVGVIVVLMFMVIYYRVPGIAAALALIVFILLNLALFKLRPVTLTLPAITGFLISVGTAVDGNILIFERFKEELRNKKSVKDALDDGFQRAWSAIFTSNLSTMIIAGILFLFGQTPGASIVSGFAITLFFGLALNMFTAVLVTRTFLHVLMSITRNQVEKNQWLLGV